MGATKHTWAGLLHRLETPEAGVSGLLDCYPADLASPMLGASVTKPIPGNADPCIPVGANMRLVASRQSPA